MDDLANVLLIDKAHNYKESPGLQTRLQTMLPCHSHVTIMSKQCYNHVTIFQCLHRQFHTM